MSGATVGCGVMGGRRAAALAAGLIAAALLCAASAGPAQAANSKCPGTFTVLHNDHIGNLKLAAGRYDIIVLTPRTLSCARASDLFAKFLQAYQGNLPGAWGVDAATATFKNAVKDQSFRVRKAGGGGGGGGGGNSGRKVCPGTFSVLHNDHIGKLKVPAGAYTITVKRMGCRAASRLLRQFLQDTDGRLGGGWKVRPRKAKFRNRRLGQSFRIKAAPSG